MSLSVSAVSRRFEAFPRCPPTMLSFLRQSVARAAGRPSSRMFATDIKKLKYSKDHEWVRLIFPARAL
jgi:hypothetical protein